MAEKGMVEGKSSPAGDRSRGLLAHVWEDPKADSRQEVLANLSWSRWAFCLCVTFIV